MAAKKKNQQKPDPERAAALKSLPKNIKKTLSEEEIEDFLYKEVWPESLFEKLKDFIQAEE